MRSHPSLVLGSRVDTIPVPPPRTTDCTAVDAYTKYMKQRTFLVSIQIVVMGG